MVQQRSLVEAQHYLLVSQSGEFLTSVSRLMPGQSFQEYSDVEKCFFSRSFVYRDFFLVKKWGNTFDWVILNGVAKRRYPPRACSSSSTNFRSSSPYRISPFRFSSLSRCFVWSKRPSATWISLFSRRSTEPVPMVKNLRKSIVLTPSLSARSIQPLKTGCEGRTGHSTRHWRVQRQFLAMQTEP